MATALNVGRVQTLEDVRVKHTIAVHFDPRTGRFFLGSMVMEATSFAAFDDAISFADGAYLVRPRGAIATEEYVVLRPEDAESDALLTRCFGR